MTFPSGLYQPPGAYHFSTDALLLASFALQSIQQITRTEKAINLADLGTGCGIIPLAILHHATLEKIPQHILCVGIEKDEELFEAALRNTASMVAAKSQLAFICGDITEKQTLLAARTLCQEHAFFQTACKTKELPLFDAVTANPPWYEEGTGRLPPVHTRRKALFGNAETLPLFFSAASRLLKERGSLFSILHPSCLPHALQSLPEAKLQPVYIRFAHNGMDKPATFCLLEARKKSKAKLVVGEPVDMLLGRKADKNGMEN